jgi:hypothetical protein
MGESCQEPRYVPAKNEKECRQSFLKWLKRHPRWRIIDAINYLCDRGYNYTAIGRAMGISRQRAFNYRKRYLVAMEKITKLKDRY